MIQLHATAIAIEGQGVLIRGPSDSGKSDLALRLIDDGAQLVADDRVNVACVENYLSISAPDNLKGLIEVRGVGVVNIGAVDKAALKLIIDLKPGADIDRLPEPREEILEGVAVQVLELNPFEASAVAKIKMALRIQEGKVTLVE
jgi:serine kinase of HPr protein (carbohydrate metabolism regulator)|tara:strand:- start:4181 stop:4615 length:435 start_codon:yes stop_codon:yes gene_type:complete